MPVGAMHAALTLVGKLPSAPRLMPSHAAAAAAPSTVEGGAAQRVLSLQVEWCSVGLGGEGGKEGSAALPRVLKPSHGPEAFAARAPQLYAKLVGSNLTRPALALAALDVFRAPWADEEGRWSLEEELGATYANA